MSLNVLVDSYASLQPALLQAKRAQLSLPFPRRSCFPNPLSPSLLSCELFPVNLFKNMLPRTEGSAPLPLQLEESSSISIILSPGFPTTLSFNPSSFQISAHPPGSEQYLRAGWLLKAHGDPRAWLCQELLMKTPASMGE